MLINAAFVIIGDEVLSGRTADKNLNFLAKELTAMGINLKEVRVVPDDEEEIILAVNVLRKKFHYVFSFIVHFHSFINYRFLTGRRETFHSSFF